MHKEPDAFFKNEEITKKYIQFLQDAVKNRSKNSNTLIEQIKIQKELLLLDINITTILKMDIYESVNYIMNMINAKKIKKQTEIDEIDSKIQDLIVNETDIQITKEDKDIIDALNKTTDNIDETIEDIELESNRDNILNFPPIPIEDVLLVKHEKYEEERSIIRESLFNKKVTTHIIKTGKNYQYKWNVSMTDLVIKIPTTWDIDIDQSLLLELYSKVFNTLGKESKSLLLNTLSKSLTVCDAIEGISNTILDIENEDAIEDIISQGDIDSDVDIDDEFDVNDKSIKRNKRVSIKTIQNFSDNEIVQLFRDRKNIEAVTDSYTSVRSLIKRALNTTYSIATEKIIKALSTVTDEELESFGISSTSHLYRNIVKIRNNA